MGRVQGLGVLRLGFRVQDFGGLGLGFLGFRGCRVWVSRVLGGLVRVWGLGFWRVGGVGV